MSMTKLSRAVDAAAVLAVFAGATAAFAVAGRGGVMVAGVAGGVEHRMQMHRADVNMPRPGVCVVERVKEPAQRSHGRSACSRTT